MNFKIREYEVSDAKAVIKIFKERPDIFPEVEIRSIEESLKKLQRRITKK
jgi:hypothetical protein